MRIRLDWSAYYRRFKRLHGDDPVSYRGRLLFPDGWQYTDGDVRGPEYRPPDDPEQLRLLQVAYWTERRRAVRVEQTALEGALAKLTDLQTVKSAPLQQVVMVEDEDTDGTLRRTTADFDPVDLQGRINWLRKDLIDCDKQLRKLNHASTQGQQPVRRTARPHGAKPARASTAAAK